MNTVIRLWNGVNRIISGRSSEKPNPDWRRSKDKGKPRISRIDRDQERPSSIRSYPCNPRLFSLVLRHPCNAPVFQREAFAAPHHGVRCEAPRPEDEPEAVPQRQQPEVAQHLLIEGGGGACR